MCLRSMQEVRASDRVGLLRLLTYLLTNYLLPTGGSFDVIAGAALLAENCRLPRWIELLQSAPPLPVMGLVELHAVFSHTAVIGADIIARGTWPITVSKS